MVGQAGEGLVFDEDYNIRLLEVDKHSHTKTLQEECGSFAQKVQQLDSMVKDYLQAVGEQAERIELEKLKAVGLRNAVATLTEVLLVACTHRLLLRSQAVELRCLAKQLLMLVALLMQDRKRREKEVESILAEKQQQLDRLLVEEQSLLRVKHEQDMLIAKMSGGSR